MRESEREEGEGGRRRVKESREKSVSYYFFFFNDTATTEIYTLSLHDALPISKEFKKFVTEINMGRS